MNLDMPISLAKAYVQLLAPLAEVVIHDISTNTICFIEGNLSKRKVGDQSHLDVDPKLLSAQIDQITYPKVNFDGRLIKSISIPLFDGKRMVALMCLNVDISIFSKIQQLAQVFLVPTNNQPEVLFKNDWQEKIHLAIHQIIQQKSWDFSNLNTAQKKHAVYELFHQGAFHEKKAADYIATVLNLSRASVFKYLKELRG